MKGLSQIISATIILAVGVTVASIYAGWAPDFAGDIVGDAANQSNSQIKCSNAALSIRDAEYDRTGQVIEFDVENSGTIRLSHGLQVGAFNSSSTLNRTSISRLDVGETHHLRIDSSKAPSRILVTSTECPELGVEETRIDVHK